MCSSIEPSVDHVINNKHLSIVNSYDYSREEDEEISLRQLSRELLDLQAEVDALN